MNTMAKNPSDPFGVYTLEEEILKPIHIWTGLIPEFSCNFSVYLIDDIKADEARVEVHVTYPRADMYGIGFFSYTFPRAYFVSIVETKKIIDEIKAIYLRAEQTYGARYNDTVH